MRHLASLAVLAASACFAALLIAAPVALPQSPPNVVLPQEPPGAHWVWVGDYQSGNYGRSVLYDADTATILGMIDTG
jgi:hypothetical protein